MRKVLRRRPAPATLISLLALFVALGGTSYAAVLITGKNIKNGTVTGKDIKNSTLTGAKVKNRSLTGSDIKTGSLTGKQIAEAKLGKVPFAGHADNAGSAGNAGHANNADHADNADNAGKVDGKNASDFAVAERWALIQGTATTATILAQSGSFSNPQRLSTGLYEVDAGDSIASLPLSATINGSSTGMINAAPCGGTANNPGGVNCTASNNTDEVIVRTLSAGAAAADRTFYIRIGG